jgi:hypothetical protein
MGATVFITEIDPINALQAAMEGYRVVQLEDVIEEVDIVVTATGNDDVVTCDHILQMPDHAIVCNIGHFDTRSDRPAPPVPVDQRQAPGRPHHLPNGRSDHPAGRGAPGEPRLRHRPQPSS